MRAIVESGGFQYKVTEETTIYVPKMEAQVGQVLRLSNVLMLYDMSEVLVGSPYVEGASVEGKVVSHGKRPKIIVYKYKSKKNYRRKRGHRQQFTELLITKIARPGKPTEALEKKPETVLEEEKKEAVTRKEPISKTTAKEAPKRRRRILRRRRQPKHE